VTARGRLTIAGALAQKPGQAGHAWQFLQYMLGFGRLGWDVLFIDALHDWTDSDQRVGWLRSVMAEHGLEDSWSVVLPDGSHAGRTRPGVLRHVRDSDFLLNVMGYLADSELLAAADRRVFLDTDPGFGQMWRDLGLADIFAGHDDHVTIAERIGARDCTIPDCGLRWITTPQPVVLSWWPVLPLRPGACFTTVGRWRGAYDPIDHAGRRYGLRAHQFRKFAELPSRCEAGFTMALDIHSAESADLALLDRNRWTLADPARIAGTPRAYRSFIEHSAAEFMVAKGMYVQSRSGWFSERSICYLASGRPVLAQDTGLADLYPLGEGLLAFETLEQAIAGVEAISADPAGQSRAARALAEEHFDSDKVLGRLLDELGGSR
jgi:hypothetical protein